MQVRGIDVSVYQKNVDYNKVKASGIDFVIIRAGFGRSVSQKDKQFETHYKNAKAAGLGVGAYWYSYAMSPADAEQEAKAFLEVVKGKQFDYPVYYDVEEGKQFALGKTAVSNIIKAFLSTVEAAGYWVGLYCSTYYLNTYVTEDIRNRYAIWVAQYSKSCSYKGQHGIWQYGVAGNSKWDTFSTKAVSGVNGECDLDYCYIDYPSAIKGAGLNGYNKVNVVVTPAVTTKTVDEVAQEVIDGKWGNGNERKSKLESAGYDYSAVQAKVNNLVKKKSVDELAKEVIAGKWGVGDARKKALTVAGYDYSAVQKRVNQLMKK